jgi:lipopolysaccharide/colanic/teichoic acid biosynthesis glycosyltransferase
MKRCFDLFFSSLGIAFLSPFYIFISIIIKISSKGPVIFQQERIGKFGRPFSILKFRTMVQDSEQLGPQITLGNSDQRITEIGKILRRTKIDELPQLFNVWLGEMSFVGPRPEVEKYVKLYTDKQKEVLTLRPGITDLASIEFRNESELLEGQSDPEQFYITEIMPKKLDLNLEYVKQQNLKLDIKLIFKTMRIL